MNDVNSKIESTSVSKLRVQKSQVVNKLKVKSKVISNVLEFGAVRLDEKLQDKVQVSSEESQNKVKLFEKVHASGLPNFQRCRITVSELNMKVWRERLVQYEDKVICEYLQYGFPLDFNREKELKYEEVIKNHKGARDYPVFIAKYLKKECSANRIAGPFSVNPLSVPLMLSPVNTVPKTGSDERRVIVDLSWPEGFSVNSGISKEFYMGEQVDLHYTSVEEICQLVLNVGPGALIYKRDLRHAYRQIPIDPRDYRYLGYFWEDHVYFDSVLAMGQRNAAMACSRTTDAIMYMHSQDGFLGNNYLDDLIGVEEPDRGTEAYVSLGKLLESLGLLENFEKACPPNTIQAVLGVQINTVDLTMSVTPERLEEIRKIVKEWSLKMSASKNELQSLIGKLIFVAACVQSSRIFLNRMLCLLRSMSTNQSVVKLSECFRKDLRWWSLFVNKYNGVSFIPSSIWNEPDVVFSTDSCLTGCGGVCGKEYFHVDFPSAIVNLDLRIHHLELLGVLLGVRSWGYKCQSMKLQVFCDNQASVDVINSGKARDKFMASCLRELWLEVAMFGFELRAVHLPGVDNRIADSLSRWNIHPKYQKMFREFTNNEKYFEIFIPAEMFNFTNDL